MGPLSTRTALLGGAVLAVAGIVLAVALLVAPAAQSPAPASDRPTAGPGTTPRLAEADRATVAFVAPDGTVRGTRDVSLATTAGERYIGLSHTESLGPNEGMLFVHDADGPHAYVMRDMAFPIDIVFVGTDGQITTIHHAPVEDPPLERYRGRGVWVIETPYRWTADRAIAVGARVRIRNISR